MARGFSTMLSNLYLDSLSQDVNNDESFVSITLEDFNKIKSKFDTESVDHVGSIITANDGCTVGFCIYLDESVEWKYLATNKIISAILGRSKKLSFTFSTDEEDE